MVVIDVPTARALTLQYSWGAASDVVPRFVPAAQWTGAHKGPAFFAYSDNYLIDVFGVIVDVEASRAILRPRSALQRP
jgi:hypothetical protein